MTELTHRISKAGSVTTPNDPAQCWFAPQQTWPDPHLRKSRALILMQIGRRRIDAAAASQTGPSPGFAADPAGSQKDRSNSNCHTSKISSQGGIGAHLASLRNSALTPGLV
jgi:hypothetical protein